MSVEHNRLHDYKEKTKVDGEDLVRNSFPKRVFELEEVLKSELFSFDASNVYSEVNIPYPPTPGTLMKNLTESLAGDAPTIAVNKMHENAAIEKPILHRSFSSTLAFPNGPVPFNRHIKAMIEKTKPCIFQLMMEAQLVRLWVQYNIPRIEDGNNFGVGIQEEVLSEASSIERDACTFLDQITRYFASRGKLVGKVAKFPHIDDFRECIRDMDEKQAITMRYIIMEIRNHYATLHDIILKNIDRIKMPRSNNAINLY